MRSDGFSQRSRIVGKVMIAGYFDAVAGAKYGSRLVLKMV